MARDRQHWLPQAYLRPFRAGKNDSLYCLDLFKEPYVWRHVGFNDVCNTRGYHSHRTVDQQVDRGIVQDYAAIVRKILPVTSTMPLCDVLSSEETHRLWHFASVHMFRNPQFVYRWYQLVLREWILIHPRKHLPRWLTKDLPQVAAPIWALREGNRQVGHLTSRLEKEAVILAVLHSLVAEDQAQYGRRPMIEPFQERMLRALGQPERWHFGSTSIIYSEQLLFTVDNPFVVSEFPAGVLTMTLPLTPHHLLVGSPTLEFELDPMLAASLLPYTSFSTKVLASEPMDLALIRVNPLPHEIDPAFKDAEPDLSRLSAVFFQDLPVVERKFAERPGSSRVESRRQSSAQV